ncbi:MAG: hypothetical protein BMS9Abin02_2101 [Anaerolineae bacterium]|nr:MAG: hypothetical protein BMS9Abin02_2101 [Anaerolineae bacterium]
MLRTQVSSTLNITNTYQKVDQIYFTNTIRKETIFYQKMKTVTIFLMFISLFLLVGCNGSTPTEPAETTVPPTDSTQTVEPPAAEPTQPPAEINVRWNPDPTQNIHVTNLGGDQAIPRIVTGDNDDIYVAWFSNPNGENYDVRTHSGMMRRAMHSGGKRPCCQR